MFFKEWQGLFLKKKEISADVEVMARAFADDEVMARAFAKEEPLF